MIAVIDYHKGNLKSVERGLVGVGADARITDSLDDILRADALVLPGVGAFTDAAESMCALGQMDVIRTRIQEGVPFLGICLGQHLLYQAGEEHAQGDPTPGLGLIDGVVRALPHSDAQGQAYKIPHVGWNSIDIVCQSELFDGITNHEYFYFTHSYAAPLTDQCIATTTHSITFPSVVQLGNKAFAVQFHPEKSSDAGAHLLKNFVKLAECM